MTQIENLHYERTSSLVCPTWDKYILTCIHSYYGFEREIILTTTKPHKLQCLWDLGLSQTGISLSKHSEPHFLVQTCFCAPRSGELSSNCLPAPRAAVFWTLFPTTSKVTPSWFLPQVTKILHELFLTHKKELPCYSRAQLKCWSSYPSLKLEKPVSFIQVITFSSFSLMLSQESSPLIQGKPLSIMVPVWISWAAYIPLCCCWGVVNGLVRNGSMYVLLHFCLRLWIHIF